MTKTEQRTKAKRKEQDAKRRRREAQDAARDRRDRKLAELGDHYGRELARLHTWYSQAKRAVWAEFRQATAAGEATTEEEAA